MRIEVMTGIRWPEARMLAAALAYLLLALAPLHALPAHADAPVTVGVSAADATAAPVAVAASAAAAAAVAAPVPDKGDTSWMMTSTVLVILMTIPGLALFYGGLVRGKNVLSVLMQVFVVFSLMAVLWAVYGYSLAFTAGGDFFGGFSRLFLKGLDSSSVSATFSKGVYIPEYVFMLFQLTFAAITPCLIVGAFAERAKFSAVLIFITIWWTFAYLPIAHMVWYWAGPDAYSSAEAGAKAASTAGFLFQKGALDFAGGTVVHINAGIAGLVGAIVIGRRVGYGKTAMAPHNVPFTMIGAALLWVGWFGFNVGSNLESNGFAGQVFANTLLATAAATLAWMFAEWAARGTPTMIGAASGAVAGLVAITPACGWVGPMGAIVIGALAGLVCLFAVSKLKGWFRYDDSLDVFGVHCIGGILGALLTGFFNDPQLGGTGVYDYVANQVGAFSLSTQMIAQLWGVAVTLVWSGVVAYAAYKIVDLTIGLRISEDKEREGLDTTEHGEHAYND